jgi:hypothetical protein
MGLGKNYRAHQLIRDAKSGVKVTCELWWTALRPAHEAGRLSLVRPAILRTGHGKSARLVLSRAPQPVRDRCGRVCLFGAWIGGEPPGAAPDHVTPPRALERASALSRPLSRFTGCVGRSVVCGMTAAPFLAGCSRPIGKPFKGLRSCKARKGPQKCGMTHK